MTKTEIIDAAFRVWGRNFYRKTSLSQLATELKVSKPALYRHFLNKQALNAAMTERFFDDFAAYIKTDMLNGLNSVNPDNDISSIIKNISGFFAKNVYLLYFSLINIYDRNIDGQTISDNLKARNVDMGVIQVLIDKKYLHDTVVIRLIFATLTFLMSDFHKSRKTMENPPSDEDVNNISLIILKTIQSGLGFSLDDSKIDFERLEKLVQEMPFEHEQITGADNSESSRFFKAVAQAVAQAGPWDVSMEMVAKKLGLSKSSLYVHFKNRKDMLRRLFITEFKRIFAFAKQGISLSSDTREQLYLGLFTISVYLRARPEILIAIDWIRTRKLELGKGVEKHHEIFRLFEYIDIKSFEIESADKAAVKDDYKLNRSHLIIFLLINVLTQSVPQDTDDNKKMIWLCDGLCMSASSETVTGNIQNHYIRILYKFILNGLGGFLR